ncbi:MULTISPECIES: EAL domain-containing protein [unclassified Marinobacter]|uniref:EAL domain-containing protein n=1 Tax=unclassified Marinobacter TaxID=83889 RepID=UPI00192767D7|nr:MULTISPECIES: EAL domain-containing protein [unclassified Marinobacter]MBL3824016.1 EAL domain-containing protein [Marinobacter sp. MC3]MBL3892172.1 EAL domain-containing protein [Marinobacter sp. MW3]
MTGFLISLTAATNKWSVDRIILLTILAAACQFFLIIWALSVSSESGVALISYLLAPVVVAAAILGMASGVATSIVTFGILHHLRTSNEHLFADIVYLFWLIVIAIVIGLFRRMVHTLASQDSDTVQGSSEQNVQLQTSPNEDGYDVDPDRKKYLIKFENAESLLEITSKETVAQLLEDFFRHVSQRVEGPKELDSVSDEDFIFSVLSKKYSAKEIKELLEGFNRSDISDLLLDADIRQLHPGSRSAREKQARASNSKSSTTETRQSSKSDDAGVTINDVGKALKNQELFLEYQPRLDTMSGRFTGMEALVRWNRGGKTLYPRSFLAFIENTRLSLPFNKWVIDQVIQLMESRIDKGKNVAVSINLSKRELFSEEMLAHLRQRLSSSRIRASRLGIEIDESAFKRALATSPETLAAIRKLGVEIVIDGYGSQHFNLFNPAGVDFFDAIKVDAGLLSWKAREAHDQDQLRIIKARLGEVDVRVILKNIERKDQLKLVKKVGSDEVQGYLIARPFQEDAVPWDRFV